MIPPSLQVPVWATAHSSLRMGVLEAKSGKESSVFSFVLFFFKQIYLERDFYSIEVTHLKHTIQ